MLPGDVETQQQQHARQEETQQQQTAKRQQQPLGFADSFTEIPGIATATTTNIEFNVSTKFENKCTTKDNKNRC